MPLCKNHAVGVAVQLYNKDVAYVLCNLLKCSVADGLEIAKSDLNFYCEEIQNASSKENQRAATEALLCVLTGLTEMRDREAICEHILCLCKKGLLDKKLMYLALSANPKLDFLLGVLDHDRRYLKNEEILCEGLSESLCNIIMELFLITVKTQHHWFLFLLDKLSSLLNQKEFDPIKKLVSRPFFNFLRPILFLYVLQQNSDISILKVTSDLCIEEKECEPSILLLAKKVQWHLTVITWLRENGLSVHTSSPFHSQPFGTLSLMLHFCNISDFQWEKTHDFLAQNSHEGGCVAKWEVSLFDAFNACALAFECVLNHVHSQNRKSEQLKGTDSKSLEKLKKIICQLQPLSMRLHVLENIFSLLFLQYEDFKGDVHSDSEEDERETNQSHHYDEGQMTNLSYDIMSSSLTSIGNTIEPDPFYGSRLPISSILNHDGHASGNWHQQKHGFVCDRFMARDLLKLLEICLDSLQEFDEICWSNEESIPETLILANNDKSNIDLRLGDLKNKVSNALWKLEIILGLQLVQKVEVEDVSVEKILLPDWLFYHCLDDDSASDDETPGIDLPHIGLKRSDAEKSSESGSQSTTMYTSQALSVKWNRVGRHRSTTRLSSRGTKDSTIKRMLASKQSFVAQCLSRGDFSAAKEAVQALDLDGSAIAVEVTFIEAYHSLKEKVNNCAEESSLNIKSPQNQHQKSTLKAIQRAASAGVQASSLNKEVEALLCNQQLPCITMMEQSQKDFQQSFGCSSTDQPLVCAAIDTVLMLSKSAQQAANFLNIASKHSSQLRNLQTALPSRSCPMGYIPLIQNILQVTVIDSSSPSKLLHRWDVPNFSSRGFRDALQFWESFEKLLEELISVSSNHVILYPKFMQLLSSCSSFKGLDCKQEHHYLQNLKSYLKFLKACMDRSSGFLCDDSLTKEHLMLLEKCPNKLLVNMVLGEGLLPQSLESVASQLGCNLPHILSSELCSSLVSVPPARQYVHVSASSYPKTIHVLNTSDVIGPVRHPLQVVEVLLSTTLSELTDQLSLLKRLDLTQKDSILMSSLNVKRINPILAATWELRDVDLKLLQPGAETLTFFCNLANLMWIHSLTYLSETNQTVFNDVYLKFLVAGYPVQQLASLNSFAYEVGSVGVLTLWEVRRLALGVDLMKPVGTRSLEEYAFKVDSCDPLALFIISTGTQYSPKVQILHAESLEEQLQQSVREYIQHSVEIQSGQVIIPSLVHQYIQNTGQNMRVFLLDHLCGPIQDLINDLPVASLISNIPDDRTPQIVLNYNTSSTYKILDEDEINTSYTSNANLDDSMFLYIKSHSPTVALLLEEVLKKRPSDENTSEIDEEAQEAIDIVETISEPQSFHQYSSLTNLCQRPEILILSQMFNNNILLCSLHSVAPQELLWGYLNFLVLEKQWQSALDLLRSLPQLQLQRDPLLRVMLDLTLMEVVVKGRDLGQTWSYSEQIDSLLLCAKCVMTESIYWPGEVCYYQLKKFLQSPEMKFYPLLFNKAKSLLHSVEVHQKLLEVCEGAHWKSWQEVQTISQKNPAMVLDQILSHQSAAICVSWIELHNILGTQPHLIDSKVVVLLLNESHDNVKDVERLLQSMPFARASKICCEALEALRSVPALRFCVDYLNSNKFGKLTPDTKKKLETIAIGIQMIEVVPELVQHECIELVQNPLLIIEQLIMNLQLEAAQQMLNILHHQLVQLGPKSLLSIPALDSLVRQYAEKALEFRISQVVTSSQTSETSVLLASSSSHSGTKGFIIPLSVPSKSEWIPNEQTCVCMNCQISTFTMFNRRHHCRRCGRVVCAQCSPHRMLVEGYETLKVRVCSSCVSKINTEAETETSSVSEQPSNSNTSVSPEYVWRLSNIPAYNDTIREEFAYEHAPSVSLCLSILKLHSESAACPNFLVDSCETILSYLQPNGDGPNPEVDYGFVIEMCRSLVLAAKVKCAQWGYVSDEPNCDQRLSKIDLFGLLVSHGCASLIPKETTSHGLRRLQTQLLEAELWELALEVSTKSGMERTGVWTAWGKGCLRAGCWEEAREKFAHCFPNSSGINKSAPDSPLLFDILQILESVPHSIDQEVLRKAEAMRSSKNRLARAPAVAVLHSLASLKSISQGKFSHIRGRNGSLEPIVYAECCYYLKEYGSHSTYLQFLVRHNDLSAAAEHTLAHSVDPHIFFESVYMPCLRKGQTTPLHCVMTAIDSTLLVWKNYLHGICAALERRKLLHTLYEVQQWSKDHVRAAMTCIRFYHLNAKTYSQLSSNINYLMYAQSHLEGALAVASASRKTSQSDSSGNSSAGSNVHGSEAMWLQLTPKELDHHMSTVERQKELSKFLSAYEAEGNTLYEAAQWFPHAFAEPLAHGLPTLFGSPADRRLLAGLCLFCGKNVEEGYGIVYRIIEGYNLCAHEIYEAVAVALFCSGRVMEITQLLNCVRSSGVPNALSVCDSVLMACVNEMPKESNTSHVDFLIRNLSDQVLKIKAFIACGQLKSAYLLAVKHDRLDDIDCILNEAEKLGQTAIKKICLKRLGRL